MSSDLTPPPMSEDRHLVHFGPVWGRGPSESMALCAPQIAAGRSNTMTRTASITCVRCRSILVNLKWDF